MKKVCVLGGSGFLGSHVVDCLSLAGYDVTIYDKSASPWRSENQKMIIGDLLDLDGLKKVIKGMDIVYNFAALSDLNDALHNPLKSVQVNILGNANALESCRIQKVSKYIYASTVYVFSRDGGFYRCSKQAAESYIEEYKKVYDLDYTILRYGSLYGPRSDKKNGLYRIIKAGIENGFLSYDGSPNTLREYIHIYDAAKASVEAISDKFTNQNVTITGQQPMRITDLLKVVSEILGITSEIKINPSSQSGHYVRTPYAYQPNMGKKYAPDFHVDLGHGLLELIKEIKLLENDE